LEELATKIKGLSEERETGWISVEDKLPEIDLEVLVYCPLGNTGVPFQCVAYFQDDSWYDSTEGRLFDTEKPVSHWMTLPSPPAKDR